MIYHSDFDKHDEPLGTTLFSDLLLLFSFGRTRKKRKRWRRGTSLNRHPLAIGLPFCLTQAYVFYLADKDSDGTTVASASFACDNTTGLWTPSAIDSASSHNEYISDTTNCAATAPAILENSGLAALYLNAGDGMRVFFKTAEFQTHYLQYTTSGQCTGWSYVGIASNLTTGNEVSAAFLKTKSHVWTIAQTVFANQSALADTSGEVEISTSNAHDTEDLWSISMLEPSVRRSSMGWEKGWLTD